MAYKFPTRTSRVKIPGRPPFERAVKEEEFVGTIAGKKASSKEEWRIAIALDKVGLSYEYQLPIGGGRSVRGGMVLDFLVYTKPLPTPLLVQGKYWHTGRKGRFDPFNEARIKSLLGGRSSQPKEVWDYEIPNQSLADSWVRRNLI